MDFYETTTRPLSKFSALLGSTVGTCTCVSPRLRTSFWVFQREGGPRILRSFLVYLAAHVGVRVAEVYRFGFYSETTSWKCPRTQHNWLDSGYTLLRQFVEFMVEVHTFSTCWWTRFSALSLSQPLVSGCDA